MTTGRSEPGAPARVIGSTRPIDASRAEAVARLPDRIAFLGFGLIGGSIALALRDAGSTAHLAAWTPDRSGPRAGLERGTLDAAPGTAEAAIRGAQLVILAGPPMAVLAALDGLAGSQHGSLASDVTITDVASTKGLIVARAEDLGLPFVGGHPMAGRETAGFESATAELFLDRPWVVVPPDEAATRDVDRVEALARAAGGEPLTMSAIDHDLAVAAISHLPLVAAAALVESVAGDAGQWATARTLAASGWRDMTRLARGDAEMGGGMLATNARPIAGAVRAYRDALDTWLGELERLSDESAPAMPAAADADRLRARLAAARALLEAEPRS
jgi:prephenate dehydrogenase